MLSGDVFGADDKGINIGAWAEDAQTITSISKDSTARSLLDRRVVGMRSLGDLSDELNGDILEGFENSLPS